MCVTLGAVLVFSCCKPEEPNVKPIQKPQSDSVDQVSLDRAEEIFDKIFEYYATTDKDDHIAPRLYNNYLTGFLDKDSIYSMGYWELYAAVWGYGSVLSAYNAIFQRSNNNAFQQKNETKVMEYLEEYWCDSKQPPAYASYFYNDDRYYDDNVWIGIDMVELYERTHNAIYLDKAEKIWNFLMSGMDEVLGGGIYWQENNHQSKNTCSNAPVVVFGVKMYEATKDASYLNEAKDIYAWTKKNLQDPSDYLYWDNMRIDGSIETSKFPYNSGQMIQGGVLLYEATGDESYLNDAKQTAEAAFNHFTYDYQGIRMLTGDTKLWFHAIMFRGFAELYEVDGDVTYIAEFRKMLNHAWLNARDEETGLFRRDLSGDTESSEDFEVLTEGAIAEMYARLSTLN